mgnify:CR=1 FL=1
MMTKQKRQDGRTDTTDMTDQTKNSRKRAGEQSPKKIFPDVRRNLHLSVAANFNDLHVITSIPNLLKKLSPKNTQLVLQFSIWKYPVF